MSVLGFDLGSTQRSCLQVVENEKDWKVWCDSETPEEEKLPCGYGDTLGTYTGLDTGIL